MVVRPSCGGRLRPAGVEPAAFVAERDPMRHAAGELFLIGGGQQCSTDRPEQAEQPVERRRLERRQVLAGQVGAAV